MQPYKIFRSTGNDNITIDHLIRKTSVIQELRKHILHRGAPQVERDAPHSGSSADS